MEFERLEREMHVDADPEVVFEVITRPEHLTQWWPDDAELDPTPGATGEVRFGDPDDAYAKIVPLTVVAVDPPRHFAFRWAHPSGEAAAKTNSFLVTFDLEPSGDGTLVRFTETGFREQGWDDAAVEEQYRDHRTGWDNFLPRLVAYVGQLETRR